MGLLQTSQEEQIDGEPPMGEGQERSKVYSPESAGQTGLLSRMSRPLGGPGDKGESKPFECWSIDRKRVSKDENGKDESSQGDTSSNIGAPLQNSTEKGNKDQKCNEHTAPSSVRKLELEEKESPSADTVPICTFKKGLCLEHKIMGEKRVTTSKKWGNTKKGYGWIYSRKVTWVCRARNLGPADSDNSTLESIISLERKPAIKSEGK